MDQKSSFKFVTVFLDILQPVTYHANANAKIRFIPSLLVTPVHRIDIQIMFLLKFIPRKHKRWVKCGLIIPAHYKLTGKRWRGQLQILSLSQNWQESNEFTKWNKMENSITQCFCLPIWMINIKREININCFQLLTSTEFTNQIKIYISSKFNLN